MSWRRWSLKTFFILIWVLERQASFGRYSKFSEFKSYFRKQANNSKMCNPGMGSMPGTCCGPTGGLGPCLLCGPYNGQWFRSINHCCGPCGPYGCCSCYGPYGGHC